MSEHMSAEMDVEGLARWVGEHCRGNLNDLGLNTHPCGQCRACRVQSLLRMAVEFDAAPDDAEWEPPHPIFQMAADRDAMLKAAQDANVALVECQRTVSELATERAALTRQLQEAEDMANVGRSLMEQIESNAESLRGWAPLGDPAEIVVDLINQRDEAESRLQEAVEELLKLVESAYVEGWQDAHTQKATHGPMSVTTPWEVSETRRALTERSKS